LRFIWNTRAWPHQRDGLRAGDDLARSAAEARISRSGLYA